jgi:hypothetical protein
MTEWTTIRVEQSAKEAAAERKPDEMTWSEFVAAEEYDPAGIDPKTVADHVAAELREELPGAVVDELEGRRR